jgi:hypothetical protein
MDTTGYLDALRTAVGGRDRARVKELVNGMSDPAMRAAILSLFLEEERSVTSLTGDHPWLAGLARAEGWAVLS